MSVTGTDFEDLMRRVRSGDPEAARTLFERYGRHIRRVVRRRLSQRMRSQFDSTDFEQDAWASFFHIPPDQFDFKTPEELVHFLGRLASHKVYDAYRQRRQGAKRDVGREVPLEPATESHAAAEPPGPQATPSQEAMAAERWRGCLEELSAKGRRAAEMLREGYSHAEIAEYLGVNPKTVQRVLARLAQKLKKP